MRRHRIIIIPKKDVEKANLICSEIYGKAALETFTIGLYDNREYEMKRWCCWSLEDEEYEVLLKAFDEARIIYHTHEREKTEPADILKSLNLHLREPEGDDSELPKR